MQELHDELTLVQAKLGSVLGASVVADIEKTYKIMNNNEIRIGVFGHQNCGKSTFLNALLRSK